MSCCDSYTQSITHSPSFRKQDRSADYFLLTLSWFLLRSKRLVPTERNVIFTLPGQQPAWVHQWQEVAYFVDWTWFLLSGFELTAPVAKAGTIESAVSGKNSKHYVFHVALKGFVKPKDLSFVINYSCHSTNVRHFFIFGTHSFDVSESFLTVIKLTLKGIGLVKTWF